MSNYPSLAAPAQEQVKAAAGTKRLFKVTYPTLFCLFLFGSVMGIALEGVWLVVTRGRWEYHPTTVVGPFCVIYGIGAAIIYWIAARMGGKSLLTQFALFSLAGSLVEYFSSLFQELCFGSVSWNYSRHFMNIGGRVSLRMTLLWGILGVVFVQFIFPPLTRLFARIQTQPWRLVCSVLTVLMAVDLLVSATAIARWHTRLTDNTPPGNQIECWLDKTYDNDTMRTRFPNMKFTALS